MLSRDSMGGVQLQEFGALLDHQSGIITRAQILDGGGRQHDLARWVRRRDLRRVLPGVYVNHTGALTWWQRAWAAVLFAEPAALALTSATRAEGGQPVWLPGFPADPEVIHIVVARGRHLKVPRWIKVHRCQSLDGSVLWSASPPRQRSEEAALDVAIAHLESGSKAAHLRSVAALAEPLQARRTTTDRMLSTLDRRQRARNRAWMAAVIADIADGATSVLEREFVLHVERAHRLPPALRQVEQTTASGRVRRDAEFLGAQVVELDGRAFHQGAFRRDGDLERDLDAATLGLATTRLGWGQVFDRPCETAGKVGVLLVARGWTGVPVACGPTCVAPAAFRAADPSAVPRASTR